MKRWRGKGHAPDATFASPPLRGPPPQHGWGGVSEHFPLPRPLDDGLLGQVQGEGGSRARLALQRHPTAVQFDDRLDQSQRQSRPALLPADEAVEDVGLHVEGDAAALVGDLEGDLAARAGAGQGDSCPAWGLAQGVFQKVVQRLPQPVGVAADQAGLVVADDLDRGFKIGGLAGPAFGRLGQQAADWHIAHVQRHLARVDLGHVEHIVDGPGQLARG